ncbi:MAG: hypothetical protein A3G08_03445 [Candidatus Magasanikbacteria bacterium RIFCSPLOWO2_12_FULL_47_9b]|nr:MAG: hypothetical protein A3I74_04090 [Candidatus Magasanikbacteria bacterium RIFCSPLOWO2_02_FULL_47_16]OGH79341.1 MAG: hypothetical protein A3C10_04630 [Candidatus Magasanikbacteria bacterium RIFCSPHIGHO2_02_FULL_48_18]OGH83450.1 MAG: hypothetical protein A3G08_03445 [Candidatus Magasanikbacteria bacterium RIFCSPLOWO2_12_FULL_47_9b]
MAIWSPLVFGSFRVTSVVAVVAAPLLITTFTSASFEPSEGLTVGAGADEDPPPPYWARATPGTTIAKSTKKETNERFCIQTDELKK